MRKHYFIAGDLIFRIKEKFFDYLRLLFWKFCIGKIGKGSFIKDGVRVVGNPKRIEMGSNFKIWQNCVLTVKKGTIVFGNDGLLGIGSIINASAGRVIIGNNVAIAPHVKIFSYSHHYKANDLTNECYKVEDVIIHNNVLIGAGAIILPGVIIGNNTVIAAGAVVNKNVNDGEIVGGIPIKILQYNEVK